MNHLPVGYSDLLGSVKEQIRRSQIKAAVAVNTELIQLYWRIGQVISTRFADEAWGTRIVNRLASDLKGAFPGMRGLSARNLRYMRSMAEAYPDEQMLQQLVAKIPWGHHCTLIDRVKAAPARLWYIAKTIEFGWSRAVLLHHIDAQLYEREGKAITNFEATLPAPQSDLATAMIRDPYHLDFLDVEKTVKERELEAALVRHMRDFLIELGAGFAFVGNQYPIDVDGEEFRIDLLFYHLKLRCFVVLELKTGAFKPEYAGKMNFYLAAIDKLVRHQDDQPSIGIILCRSKGDAVVKFALEGLSKPVGVATHRLVRNIEAELPSAEELAQELRAVEVDEKGATTASTSTTSGDGRAE